MIRYVQPKVQPNCRFNIFDYVVHAPYIILTSDIILSRLLCFVQDSNCSAVYFQLCFQMLKKNPPSPFLRRGAINSENVNDKKVSFVYSSLWRNNIICHKTLLRIVAKITTMASTPPPPIHFIYDLLIPKTLGTFIKDFLTYIILIL